ncbi:MAG: hypothetical protein JJT94_02130 [Bernardetiaceae bacterium]|nr:hypothetical protein [Bernardetiaceae bacterium]
MQRSVITSAVVADPPDGLMKQSSKSYYLEKQIQPTKPTILIVGLRRV